MAKWGKCDFGQLQQLQKQLEKAERNADEFCEMCARELAGRLLALVIPRTPVGKAPKFAGGKTVRVKLKGADGKTRNRAFLTREGAILERYWSGYTGGTLRRGWTAGASVQRQGSGYTIEVLNEVFYASYVEYGHRQEPGRYVPAIGKRLKKGWVEGKFMLTLSVKDVERMAPRLLEKELKKFLEECLDNAK